jgi:hypothetical protein
MELITDAKAVMLKAWSVRFASLATIFAAIDLANQMLPFISGMVPDKTFTALSAFCGMAAVIARFVKQSNLIPPADK